MIDEKGSPIKVDHLSAIHYCETHGAQLPTTEYCIGLESYFSERVSAIGKKYTPQILNQADQTFWTSTLSDPYNRDHHKAYVFIGSKGILFAVKVSSKHLVRCVRRLQHALLAE
jgi:hypothetical protein